MSKFNLRVSGIVLLALSLLVLSSNALALDALSQLSFDSLQRDDNRHSSATAKSLISSTGLSELKETRKGDSRALSVVVKGQPRCMWGDLDAIAFDMAYSLKQKLFLSLEPMGVSSTESEIDSVDLTETMNIRQDGAKFQLKLPTVTQATLFGLYICTGSDQVGRCSEKKLQSPQDTLNVYSEGNQSSLSARTAEKIFYFKHIVVLPEQIMISTEAMDRIKYKSLEDYLFQVSLHHREIAKQIGKIQHLGKVLGSLPFGLENDTAIISLPFLDHERCSRKSSNVS